MINMYKGLFLLGIGDWGLGIGPNPQSPIPNPHFCHPLIVTFDKLYLIIKLTKHNILTIIF